MPNDIAHFAIHADDCQRAKRFYEAVFGWTFEPWGPPEFWRVHTSPGGIHGALQRRRAPVTGGGVTAFECTIAVEDVAATAAANVMTVATRDTAPFKAAGLKTVDPWAA